MMTQMEAEAMTEGASA
jgi:hypothetical protein